MFCRLQCNLVQVYRLPPFALLPASNVPSWHVIAPPYDAFLHSLFELWCRVGRPRWLLSIENEELGRFNYWEAGHVTWSSSCVVQNPNALAFMRRNSTLSAQCDWRHTVRINVLRVQRNAKCDLRKKKEKKRENSFRNKFQCCHVCPAVSITQIANIPRLFICNSHRNYTSPLPSRE